MTSDVADGRISGIIGFGAPVLTSAHPADFNFTNSSFLTDKIIHNPFFTNAYVEGLVDPYFSVAIDRLAPNTSSGPGGYLALGALPPVPYEEPFTTTPVEVNQLIPLRLTGGEPIITLWTLNVCTTTTAGNNDAVAFQAVVDSGKPANVYPVDLAAAVNAAFDPPAKLIPSTTGEQMYSVACDASPPTHGVTFANKTFYMAPEDMIIQTDKGCVSTVTGLAPDEDGMVLYFLGAGWMRNVVSVFDFGKSEMRFAVRMESTTDMTGGASPSQSTAAGHKESPASVMSIGMFVAVALLALAL
jgi:hypothetical protein